MLGRSSSFLAAMAGVFATGNVGSDLTPREHIGSFGKLGPRSTLYGNTRSRSWHGHGAPAGTKLARKVQKRRLYNTVR